MAAVKGGWGSKAALVHIQRNASTVTSARLSAAGQVVSHVAAIAQRGSGGSVGIEGVACPQMQHAVLGVPLLGTGAVARYSKFLFVQLQLWHLRETHRPVCAVSDQSCPQSETHIHQHNSLYLVAHSRHCLATRPSNTCL